MKTHGYAKLLPRIMQNLAAKTPLHAVYTTLKLDAPLPNGGTVTQYVTITHYGCIKIIGLDILAQLQPPQYVFMGETITPQPITLTNVNLP